MASSSGQSSIHDYSVDMMQDDSVCIVPGKKEAAYLFFQLTLFFPEVVLHLDMNKSGNLTLMTAQHLADVSSGKIALEVADRLAGQIVKRVGMIVIGDR
jgi:hypothetical protein